MLVSPQIIFIVVVFPAPLGPKNPNISPSRIVNETLLYNFLSNAINYCGDDKLVIVKQTTENEYVKISFIDHGIGIAKEHINDIWNRYYKIDKNHDRKHEGTGIGLAIVKSVLERYGAEYGVESEEGKGSEFWFKLKMINKKNKMEKKRHEK